MRRNPKIVSLDPPMSAAAGLVPNAAALMEMFTALQEAPALLARLGFRPGEQDPAALLKELRAGQLGTGSYARAFLAPSGSVLKVTTDEADAMVAQIIVTEGGGAVPGLLKVYAVYRLPGRIMHNGFEKPAFVIISEEVYPLDILFDSLELGEKMPPGILNRELRQLSYATNALARVSRKAKPHDVLQLAMQAADDHYDISEIGMMYLHALAEGWAFMAKYGYVMRDLHAGNVGFDQRAQPVILDFGMSGTRGSSSEPIEMAENPSPKVDRVFDECFDRIDELFPDFGDMEFYSDEKAGSDNGAGSERQFAYCMDGDPISIAFAPKASKLPESHLRGLMRHEFGHALEYRYGVKELQKRLGRRLPEKVERRADAIAEAVWGEPIVYDDKLVQCVGIDGIRPRPAHLPDEKAKLRANGQLVPPLRFRGRPRENPGRFYERDYLQQKYPRSGYEKWDAKRGGWVIGPVYHTQRSETLRKDRPAFWAPFPRIKEFGKYVFEAKLRMRNPFTGSEREIDEVLGMMSEADQRALAEAIEVEPQYLAMDLEDKHDHGYWQHPAFFKAIEAAGFDGVMAHDPFGGDPEYVSFARTPVKVLRQGWADELSVNPGISPEEMRMGIEHEMEHTDDPAVSAATACDHLREIPDYYTRLNRMEREYESEATGKNLRTNPVTTPRAARMRDGEVLTATQHGKNAIEAFRSLVDDGRAPEDAFYSGLDYLEDFVPHSLSGDHLRGFYSAAMDVYMADPDVAAAEEGT